MSWTIYFGRISLIISIANLRRSWGLFKKNPSKQALELIIGQVIHVCEQAFSFFNESQVTWWGKERLWQLSMTLYIHSTLRASTVTIPEAIYIETYPPLLVFWSRSRICHGRFKRTRYSGLDIFQFLPMTSYLTLPHLSHLYGLVETQWIFPLK